MGWGYCFSVVATLPALAIAFVGYLDPFVPGLVRTPSSAWRWRPAIRTLLQHSA